MSALTPHEEALDTMEQEASKQEPAMSHRVVVVRIASEDQTAVEHVEQEIMDAIWDLLGQDGADPILDDDGEPTGAVRWRGCVLRTE